MRVERKRAAEVDEKRILGYLLKVEKSKTKTVLMMVYLIYGFVNFPLLEVQNPTFIPFPVFASSSKGSNTKHQTASTSFVHRSDVCQVYFRTQLRPPLSTTPVACKPPRSPIVFASGDGGKYSVMRRRAEIDLYTGVCPDRGCGLTVQWHCEVYGPMKTPEGPKEAC